MSCPATRWGARILTGLFVLFMLFDSAIKIIDLPVVSETMTGLGWPTRYSRFIGILELLLTVLYLLPRTALLGAVLMTGVLGGALATHLRVESPLFSHTLFSVYLGAVMWAGLYLREAALRELFPLRRPPRHHGLT